MRPQTGRMQTNVLTLVLPTTSLHVTSDRRAPLTSLVHVTWQCPVVLGIAMPRTINPIICLGFEMIAHPHLKQKQLL